VESVGELLEIARAYFGATPWWPVIKTVGALAIIAALLRFIGDRLPFIPAGLRIAGLWAGKLLVRAARASAGALRRALTPRRAKEPRWVRPLGLWMDLLLGSYFGLLFFLMFVQFSGFVVSADGSAAWWKYLAAAACAAVLLVAAKVYVVQARDAWCELRDRFRGGRPEVRLLPARTGPGNP
jgi:hypothetical protein